MTRYPNGQKVKLGDTCSREQALEWFKEELAVYEKYVDDLTRDDISQDEFDALVDFCYNEGVGGLKSSTLLKTINTGNYSPEIITPQFLVWDKEHVNGKLVECEGLERRRRSEAHLLCTGELNFFEDAA